MGIVCHCPNGHRVKVKDQMAGKYGLCPYCKAKFSILAAAGPQPDEPDHRPVEPSLPLARFVPLDPSVIATLPRALPFGTARAAALAAAEATNAEPAMHAEDADMLRQSTTAATQLHPAIADRPDLSWRIAYPGGEASEPVDAVTMQEWLAGGQAEGTELVWRADWADWMPVRGVFAEFFSES